MHIVFKRKGGARAIHLTFLVFGLCVEFSTVLRYYFCTVQIFQFEFVETRAKLKGCVILRREIDGDWLKKCYVLNIKTHEIATSTHEIEIFSKMNVSKSQTHVFWIRHIVT
jgi:hypothetical protein